MPAFVRGQMQRAVSPGATASASDVIETVKTAKLLGGERDGSRRGGRIRGIRDKGPSKVSPFLVPKLMGNAGAGQVSIHFGMQGVNYTTMSACA